MQEKNRRFTYHCDHPGSSDEDVHEHEQKHQHLARVEFCTDSMREFNNKFVIVAWIVKKSSAKTIREGKFLSMRILITHKPDLHTAILSADSRSSKISNKIQAKIAPKSVPVHRFFKIGEVIASRRFFA